MGNIFCKELFKDYTFCPSVGNHKFGIGLPGAQTAWSSSDLFSWWCLEIHGGICGGPPIVGIHLAYVFLGFGGSDLVEIDGCMAAVVDPSSNHWWISKRICTGPPQKSWWLIFHVLKITFNPKKGNNSSLLTHFLFKWVTGVCSYGDFYTLSHGKSAFFTTICQIFVYLC